MIRFLLFFILIVIFTEAKNITVLKKWQLLGASNDINLSIFKNSCADFIWSYKNNKWLLFIANNNSYNYQNRTEFLKKGDGFWIKGHDECNITTIVAKKSILIPLYSYPNWYDGNTGYKWQKLINLKKLHPKVNIVAIVNPNNGDFTKSNSDFVQGIKDLSSAGIKVIGYVYTKYGNRDINKIKKNIDNWNRFYKIYGVRGIFFDEVSTSIDNFIFYKDITNYAKSKGLDFIILNPGITIDEKYITSNIADVVVSFESPYQELMSHPPSTYNNPTDNTKLALLVYNMQGDKVDELFNFFNSQKFDYLYFTEDDSSNPWDTISKYLEKEIKRLEELQ